MPTYPPPVYSHLNATGTGPGAVIDIGIADDDGYPPVLILKMEESEPIITEVVIDGFVTTLSHAGGALDDSWEAARNASDSDDTIDTSGVVSATITINESPPPDEVFKITRSGMQFDTSALPAGTITAVALEIFDRYPDPARDATFVCVDGGTMGPYPFQTSDYGKIGSTSLGTFYDFTGQYPDGTWVSIPLAPAVIPMLNLSGNTILGAREGHDEDDDPPTPEPEGQALHRLFFFKDDHSTCCRLRVTVTTP